ncbi:sirohydrochlorin chelatase [Aneurinibacillus tyrosinisolvens]|uniref:sirohydrochlorin chelatase n=1 Tax=Aneurinibacillus tyrosinisolvens TaxID=1443435 RepID=UPI00063F928C|nr:CbiX/SirB N-terminal domain-containing protein [Aneurinibacillus tyrosinisolvens]
MKKGVLVISHGSRNASWIQKVHELVSQVDTELPVEAAFLDMVEGYGIRDGVERLEAQGVREILAVPLFVSSGSTHLNEIQYMLGLIPEPAIETELRPFSMKARMTWAGPMDDHPEVRNILRDRIKEVSTDPAEEALMLVAHGSGIPGFKEKWLSILERCASDLGSEMGFKRAVYATIHPDTVQERAAEAAGTGRLVVIPLFLSTGYYTDKVIPQKLSDIPHRYSGRAYLPDNRVAAWIEERISSFTDTD